MSVRDLVAEPPWTVELPRVSKVTPERARFGDLPVYGEIPVAAHFCASRVAKHMGRSLELGLCRRCSICGCALGRTVYSIQPQEINGPSRMWRFAPGIALSSNPGPMHASCAAYVALRCPFLRYERGRHRWNILGSEGCTRRGAAAIVGFRSYGYAPTGGVLRNEIGWEWAYLDPVERIPLRHNAVDVLGGIYDAVIAAERVDTATRLYWRDDAAAPGINRMFLWDDVVRKASAGVLVSGHTYWPVP